MAIHHGALSSGLEVVERVALTEVFLNDSSHVEHAATVGALGPTALGIIRNPGELLLSTVCKNASSHSRLVLSASSSSSPLPWLSTISTSSGTVMLQIIWLVLAATMCPLLFLSTPPSRLAKSLS